MSESQPDGSEARSYHRWQFRVGALGILLTAGYLAALLATGVAAHLRDLLAARTHHWWLAVPSALLILGAGHQLLALPVSWLGGFWLRFGAPPVASPSYQLDGRVAKLRLAESDRSLAVDWNLDATGAGAVAIR